MLRLSDAPAHLSSRDHPTNIAPVTPPSPSYHYRTIAASLANSAHPCQGPARCSVARAGASFPNYLAYSPFRLQPCWSRCRWRRMIRSTLRRPRWHVALTVERRVRVPRLSLLAGSRRRSPCLLRFSPCAPRDVGPKVAMSRPFHPMSLPHHRSMQRRASLRSTIPKRSPRCTMPTKGVSWHALRRSTSRSAYARHWLRCLARLSRPQNRLKTILDAWEGEGGMLTEQHGPPKERRAALRTSSLRA
jgi:hypothetical protein